MESLTCPICGERYDKYKDYFACWTSHLDEGFKIAKPIPIDHNEAVKYYQHNPGAIEDFLRILASEVSIFRGRVDLIGVDGKQTICIIDVTTGHDWKRKVKQLRRYKGGIRWIAKHIFGIDPPKMRLIVVKPNDYVKDVTNFTEE